MVVSDLREQPLAGGFEADLEKTTVEAIEQDGGTAVFVQCGVTDSAQVQKLIKSAVDQFGWLDSKATAATSSTWSPPPGCRAIPTNRSITPPRARRPTSPLLAIEDGHERIRVNGICPTDAETALTRELFDDKDFDKVFTEPIRLKRWGETEDIAHLAVFLPPMSPATSTATWSASTAAKPSAAIPSRQLDPAERSGETGSWGRAGSPTDLCSFKTHRASRRQRRHRRRGFGSSMPKISR